MPCSRRIHKKRTIVLYSPVFIEGNESMGYDISQVSRLFGMTPSGLRYYEQIGLIAPQYTQSGRRKYSERDLNGLMFLRYMRSLGVSMEETREYFHYDNDQSVEETGRFMLDKVREAQKTAEYYAVLARYLQEHGEVLRHIEVHADLTETTTPEYCLLALEPLFGSSREEEVQLAKWIDAAPMVNICTVWMVSDGQILSQRTGFAIRRTFAEQMHLPMLERAERMPGVRSLGAIVPVIGKERYGLDEEDIRSICERVTKRSGWKEIRITSKIFHTHMKDGVREKFYRIWANPV